MAYEAILYEVAGPVATITLNRPEALNAISPTLEAELRREAPARVLVPRGGGGRTRV